MKKGIFIITWEIKW